jgi:hypothetical protein
MGKIESHESHGEQDLSEPAPPGGPSLLSSLSLLNTPALTTTNQTSNIMVAAAAVYNVILKLTNSHQAVVPLPPKIKNEHTVPADEQLSLGFRVIHPINWAQVKGYEYRPSVKISDPFPVEQVISRAVRYPLHIEDLCARDSLITYQARMMAQHIQPDTYVQSKYRHKRDKHLDDWVVYTPPTYSQPRAHRPKHNKRGAQYSFRTPPAYRGQKQRARNISCVHNGKPNGRGQRW